METQGSNQSQAKPAKARSTRQYKRRVGKAKLVGTADLFPNGGFTHIPSAKELRKYNSKRVIKIDGEEIAFAVIVRDGERLIDEVMIHSIEGQTLAPEATDLLETEGVMQQDASPESDGALLSASEPVVWTLEEVDNFVELFVNEGIKDVLARSVHRRADAVQWIFTTDPEAKRYPLSFANCCAQLGLCAESLREGVMQVILKAKKAAAGNGGTLHHEDWEELTGAMDAMGERSFALH